MLERLYEIRFERIFQECCHSSLCIELTRSYRLVVIAIANYYI